MPRIKTIKCVDCGKEEIFERRRCRECALSFNRERVKKIYKVNKDSGKTKKRYGTGICSYCGSEMTKCNSEQYMHKDCYNSFIRKDDKKQYLLEQSGRYEARKIFSNYFDLPDDWVVHHMDENPLNNTKTNLIGIEKSAHNKLHSHLRRIRSSYEKSYDRMNENCWKTLRDKETTTWLEITSVKVLRIPCIGQSAAELLLNEEGSETMHVLPVTDNAVGEDIVQTQILKSSLGN